MNQENNVIGLLPWLNRCEFADSHFGETLRKLISYAHERGSNETAAHYTKIYNTHLAEWNKVDLPKEFLETSLAKSMVRRIIKIDASSEPDKFSRYVQLYDECFKAWKKKNGHDKV